MLSGANIMCPGLTHPNAKMTPAEGGKFVQYRRNLSMLLLRQSYGVRFYEYYFGNILYL